MTIPSSTFARSPEFQPAGAALHDVAAQFEAMLMKEAFAPLCKAMGFYGDEVVAVAAQAMIRGAGAALTGPLEAAMDSTARAGMAR
jgi:hypothetical protein